MSFTRGMNIEFSDLNFRSERASIDDIPFVTQKSDFRITNGSDRNFVGKSAIAVESIS
jgi:hypothetical protein